MVEAATAIMAVVAVAVVFTISGQTLTEKQAIVAAVAMGAMEAVGVS